LNADYRHDVSPISVPVAGLRRIYNLCP
jgi:hypothetical protein